MRSWTTRSPEATRQLGSDLAGELAADATVLLVGDLGSGKTMLAQGVAEGLGIDAGEVQSPTFTLVREHSGQRGRMIHIDLYRLDGDDVLSLGLEDLLSENSIKVIEWADRLPFEIPVDLALEMRRTGNEGERAILEIEPRSVTHWTETRRTRC